MYNKIGYIIRDVMILLLCLYCVFFNKEVSPLTQSLMGCSLGLWGITFILDIFMNDKAEDE